MHKHSHFDLEELFTFYGTDKGIWGYTPAYESQLELLRGKDVNVLEIGICGHRDIPNNVVGASLFAWREYFGNGTRVCGIDNDRRFVFNDQPQIQTAFADAYDREQLMASLVQFGELAFDFICDDAVHDPLPQMNLLRMLWPALKVGGKYAIEEACPYKVTGNDLFEMMVHPLMVEHPNMTCVEYSTHKPERLLIFTKQPPLPDEV